MIREDFHVHTLFSDGKNTPEEMVEAALEKGMTAIGFSDHSYAPCDLDCCIAKERMEEYREAITRLKARYKGRIEVYCGIEQEYYSWDLAPGFDYVIGSVHYVMKDGRYVSVDHTPDRLREGAGALFGGDMMALCEAYYENVGDVARKWDAGIVGHFDLVTKFNEGDALFDTNDPRYVRAWQRAADRLLAAGKRFEINFGAMFRGYRSTPYPARPIRDYLAARGARFILSSDAHQREALCHGFDTFDARGLVLSRPDFRGGTP